MNARQTPTGSVLAAVPTPAATSVHDRHLSAAEVAEVTRRVAAQYRGLQDLGVEDVFRLAVVGIENLVPAATCVGVTVLEPGGRLRAAVPGVELLERLQQAQAVLREGPSVSALGASGPTAPVAPVWVEDMGSETGPDGRWPRFAPEAVRLDVRSALSLPLILNGRPRVPVASLDLFTRTPGAFGSATRLLAEVYAQQTAIALDHAQRVADLGRAVQSRDVIGQAKGILMHRHRIDADGAWAMLAEASQAANLKVRDVAAWLVDDVRPAAPEGP